MMDSPWQSSSTYAIMRQGLTAQPADGSFAANEVYTNVWLVG
jgi:hypothetical protein